MKTPALSRRSLLKTAAAAGAAASVPTLASSASLKPAAETGHIRNFDMIEAFYREYPKKLAAVRGLPPRARSEVRNLPQDRPEGGRQGEKAGLPGLPQLRTARQADG